MPADIEDLSTVRNLRICQTWIEEQIAQIQEQYDYETPGEAFQALVMSLLFDLDYDAIQPEEIVDGGQDKQIDIIRIEDDEDRSFAHFHIVQAKNTPGFSSNTLIQMRNGLGWVFERPRLEYEGLGNRALVNKIGEIRQLRVEYGASNIAVSVYFVTTGDTQEISPEFLQERNILVETFANVGFDDFTFQEIGAFELVEILNESERASRQIDVDIPIVYDVNRPSVIEYSTGETRALICTVTGKELAKVANTEPHDAIFDLNVRPFYGSRGRVNADIWKTCVSSESFRFWFLNNGITMTCDSFDLNRDPDEPLVKVANAQIVNGCQTTVTLREAWKKGELKDDVRVLVRIYATDNPYLAQRITLTTNNQNRITDRDLRANDRVQVDIQRMMEEKFQYFYERKNKQYRSLRGDQRRRVVPNSKAAQAYLAIARKKPSIARGYLGRIWSEHYQEIFGNATVADLLASYLIYNHCYQKAKAARKDTSLSRLNGEVAVYGVFHLAQICGYLLMSDQWGDKNQDKVEEFLRRITAGEPILIDAYNRAVEMLLEIRKQSLEGQPNPTLYFKAGDVQRSVAQALAETNSLTA